jgi:hypothetical protein
MNRRRFLKIGVLAGVSATVAPSLLFAQTSKEGVPVRAGDMLYNPRTDKMMEYDGLRMRRGRLGSLRSEVLADDIIHILPATLDDNRIDNPLYMRGLYVRGQELNGIL